MPAYYDKQYKDNKKRRRMRQTSYDPDMISSIRRPNKKSYRNKDSEVCKSAYDINYDLN